MLTNKDLKKILRISGETDEETTNEIISIYDDKIKLLSLSYSGGQRAYPLEDILDEAEDFHV